MVVDDEDWQAAEIGPRNIGKRLRTFAEPRREPEGAAGALGAVDPDLAVHHLRQGLADDETKPGAAVSAGDRSVGLLEGLEQAGALRLAETDPGVAHRAMEQHLAGGLFPQFDDQLDLALLGELDGIGDIIDEDLAEPQRVADQQEIEPRIDIEDEFEPLGGGLAADQVADPVEDLVRLEFGAFQREFSGLQLREVENVVDDLQEHLRRLLDLRQITALVRRQVGLEQQVREADDGVHRGADLVAHIGEEVGFDPYRRIRQIGGGAHRRLRLPVLCDGLGEAIAIRQPFAEVAVPYRQH